jgi:hypothetical protein
MLTFFGLTLFVSFAVLSYPVLLEFILRIQDQSALTGAGAGPMAILIVVCAALLRFGGGAPESSRGLSVPLAPASTDPPSGTLRLYWIALAAVPSSLMLGVTTFLSTDVAVVPRLWMVSLVIYVATIIVSFTAAAKRVQPFVDRLLPLVVLPLVPLFITHTTQPAHLLMPFHLLAFLILALTCHLALAAARPAEAHRVEFYLWMLVGALLGGLFNTVLAPLVFASIAEYPIAVVLACLLRVTRQPHITTAQRGFLTVVAAGAVTLTAGVLAQRWSLDAQVWMAMLGVALVVSFSVSRQTRHFAAAVAVMLLMGTFSGPQMGDGLDAERTFFGVYR